MCPLNSEGYPDRSVVAECCLLWSAATDWKVLLFNPLCFEEFINMQTSLPLFDPQTNTVGSDGLSVMHTSKLSLDFVSSGCFSSFISDQSCILFFTVWLLPTTAL